VGRQRLVYTVSMILDKKSLRIISALVAIVVIASMVLFLLIPLLA
jgi:hypothetical protein